MRTDQELRDTVREHYASAAKRVSATTGQGCCGSTAESTDPITRDLYSESEVADLPEDAVRASLGCGNPTALAELHPGETVLDLGSGGGIDVLLSARRVGPTGKAYGVDMTDEMLELARANQRQAAVENVEFLKGTIEEIPLPDASVDVVISNCVINLSTDKDRVISEVFRVLRPGGRFAVTDVVVKRELPPAVLQSLELWAGCVAGALHETDYRQKLAQAGFDQIAIEPVRVYTGAEMQEALTGECCGGDAPVAESGTAACCSGGAVTKPVTPGLEESITPGDLDDALMSAFVRAVRPRT